MLFWIAAVLVWLSLPQKLPATEAVIGAECKYGDSFCCQLIDFTCPNGLFRCLGSTEFVTPDADVKVRNHFRQSKRLRTHIPRYYDSNYNWQSLWIQYETWFSHIAFTISAIFSVVYSLSWLANLHSRLHSYAQIASYTRSAYDLLRVTTMSLGTTL